MKIYTRTGDSGHTSLFGGNRVPKHHARIDAYGTVDETNALIGTALSYMSDFVARDKVIPVLVRIQQQLFVLGADLATPVDAGKQVPRVEPEHTRYLEQLIDTFDGDLPHLTHFILPGGSAAGAALHVARTICRRAERGVVAVAEQENLNEETVRYLNRLSDLLFVLARWVNARLDIEETQWLPEDK